jgi:hypothetical protein
MDFVSLETVKVSKCILICVAQILIHRCGLNMRSDGTVANLLTPEATSFRTLQPEELPGLEDPDFES